MRAAKLPDRKLTVEEFLEWVETDPDARFEFDDGTMREKSDVRFELHDGVVVAMAPERAQHVRTKLRAAMTLQAALAGQPSACGSFVDGIAVRIDDRTTFEPDAFVRCGDPLDGDVREISDPMIVVEVLSPSTKSRDLGEKVEGYFLLPLLHHYLIVDPERRRIIHHRRQADSDALLTRIVSEGLIRLDPPGIEVAIVDMLPPLPSDE